MPLWDGAPLEGRHIVLVAEQGYGDAIQFVRFAGQVAQHAGGVTLRAPERLHRLLKGINGVDEVVSMTAEVPEADCYLPLMDLPRLLGTDLTSIPDSGGYVSVRETAPPFRSGLNVGLVWAGSSGNPSDRRRSMTLDDLKPILNVDGCRFHSMQAGDPAETTGTSECLRYLETETHDPEDFASSAAEFINLDLLITVDTAAAHLAGALGVRTRVMLSFVADWRWMTERTDSPWYTSLRLYRQARRGDWSAVLAEVSADLRRLAEADR